MITRIKKSFTLVPASIAEAITFLVSIGSAQRDINRVKREAKAKVEAINAEAKAEVEVLTKTRDTFFNALFAFASARKVDLTKITRSQKTAAGVFGWRWTPPYVEIAGDKSDEQIIKMLKHNGLTQYVRVIEEIDREALLRDRPKLFGVSYMQRDEFFAKPKLAKEEGRAEELTKTETEAIDV